MRNNKREQSEVTSVRLCRFALQRTMPSVEKVERSSISMLCSSALPLWDALLAKNDGMPQGERLVKLNQIAIQQMQVLEGNSGRNLLK